MLKARATFRNETDATCVRLRCRNQAPARHILYFSLICWPPLQLAPFDFFFLCCPPAPFLLMRPEWSTLSAELWCGNRLAVCVLHIACSQRLRRSEQNNNHKSGLSAECQDCLVVGSLQHTGATLLSFAGKKCLRSQIPQTGHMLLGMRRLNHASSLHV